MAFDSLQSLGEEKFRAVVQKLLAGTRESSVAKLIQEKDKSRKILIEGHSDKTGTAVYNQWLSEKRAVSVKTYLVGLGINAERIKTAGLGDTQPIADNKTKEGRLKNRRVEITLLKGI